MSSAPPARRSILAITGAAFAAASAVAVLFVLPAEYAIDPTGFGRLTGLTRLAQPHVAGRLGAPTARVTYDQPFRSDVFDIPLRSPDRAREGTELEYKVRMKAGAVMVYSWTVEGMDYPDEFYFDFHGETPVGPGVPEAIVVEYQKGTAGESHGMLVAAIDGVHGWYLQNQSGATVVVHLRLSGFYELVPPGEYGNEAGILPRTGP